VTSTSPDKRSTSPDKRTSPDQPPPGAPTLCLGDPIVEFVCERPVASVSEADAFAPRVGGAVANVSVVAARRGAHVALAGGAGDDGWGRWLCDRLAREGVERQWLDLVPGAQTPVAIVTVDAEGRPSRQAYGERVGAGAGFRTDEAVRASAALLITSGGPHESEVTMRARELALSLGRPIVFDPQIRVGEWRSRAEAAAAANALVPGALLVCAGAGDAELMTGEDDPERAALALLKAGARMVVLTLGGFELGAFEGAILRGELRLDVDAGDLPATVVGDVPATVVADVPATVVGEVPATVVGEVPAKVVGAASAGEVLTGFLLARLATSAFYPSSVAASLPEAVAEAARAGREGRPGGRAVGQA
jgi:fructokinase